MICAVCGLVCGFGAGIEPGIFGVQRDPAAPEFSGTRLPPESECFANVRVEREVLVDVIGGGLGNVFNQPCGSFVELFAGWVKVLRCECQPFEMVPCRDDSFGNLFLWVGQFEAVRTIVPVGVP